MQAPCRQGSPGRRERKSALANLVRAPLPPRQLIWREEVIKGLERRAEAILGIAEGELQFHIGGQGKMLRKGETIPPMLPYACSRAVSQSCKTRQSAWLWVHEQLPCGGQRHRLHASLATLYCLCEDSSYDSDLSLHSSTPLQFPEGGG